LEDVFVRRLPAFVLGGIVAAAVAGTALAAGSKTHVMTVPLPDGSVARIKYVGDVAPKVVVEPRPVAGLGAAWAPLPLPSFAGFDRLMEQMNRHVQQLARQPLAGPGMNVASYGDMPAGVTSSSVVSYSNGGSTCTRTTEVVSQGPGKPPKVTSNVTGDCSSAAPLPPAPPPARTSVPLERT
jgi:hypothetical protein